MDIIIIMLSLLSSIFVALMVVLVVFVSFRIYKYYNSTYYFGTKHGLLDLMDKGVRGEYLVYRNLAKKFKAGDNAYYVFNAYIPSDNDVIHENECDILMIHSTGIYVIESKNHKKADWSNIGSAVNQVQSDAKHITSLLDSMNYYVECVPIVALGAKCNTETLNTYSSSYGLTVTTYKKLSKELKQFMLKRNNIYNKNAMKKLYETLNSYAHRSEAFKRNHIEECIKASDESISGKYTYQYCKNCNTRTVCVPLTRFGKITYRCTECNRRFQLRKNSTPANSSQSQQSEESTVNSTVSNNQSEFVIGCCICCNGDVVFRKISDDKRRRFVCSECDHLLDYSVPYIFLNKDICRCSNCVTGVLSVTFRNDNVNRITCSNCKNKYTYYNKNDSIVHK